MQSDSKFYTEPGTRRRQRNVGGTTSYRVCSQIHFRNTVYSRRTREPNYKEDSLLSRLFTAVPRGFGGKQFALGEK